MTESSNALIAGMAEAAAYVQGTGAAARVHTIGRGRVESSPTVAKQRSRIYSQQQNGVRYNR